MKPVHMARIPGMSTKEPHSGRLDLDSSPTDADQQAASLAALEALDAGQLVIVPTETVYGVAAREDRPEAVKRLKALKGGRKAPYSLAVADVQQLADRLKPLSGPATRIAKRWWPGPVTQVLPALEGPELGVRVVGHSWTRQMLDSCPSPVLLPSANHAGEPAPRDSSEISDDLFDDVELLVNGGLCALGESSTVVRPFPAGLEVLREGVISREDLTRHALGFILVVCSGNTCRSPMGALLLQQALQEKAQSVPGYLVPQVHSAGTYAGHDLPASEGALATMQRRGLDLESHRSSGVTRRPLSECDLILCMTESQQDAVLELMREDPPEQIPAVELFCPDGNEVLDPFGGPSDVYASCADQLEAMATRRAQQMFPSPNGKTT
jgi:tRNA threonylcarbamoyl adenosine modification protein (Sua5/YciO/YrdC/YwlC family)